jgi:hypothetical protein
VTHERDVGAFDRRAPTYDEGALGRMHHELAARTVAVALAALRASGFTGVRWQRGTLVRTVVATRAMG